MNTSRNSGCACPMTLRRMVVRVLQATRLNRLAHNVYYRYVHGFKPATFATVSALSQAFAIAASRGAIRQGDYYEFGLFKGYSFWWAQKTAIEYGASDMRFYGFDSFEGLPEVAGPDLTTHHEFYRGQYSCSYDAVRTALDRSGVDWSRTVLTRGFFNESLTDELRVRHGMRPVAIALIDCDLYASTADVLHFLGPLLMDGSILIFDDWNCFGGDTARGQRRAFAEFMDRNVRWKSEELFQYGTWGACFILRSA